MCKFEITKIRKGLNFLNELIIETDPSQINLREITLVAKKKTHLAYVDQNYHPLPFKPVVAFSSKKTVWTSQGEIANTSIIRKGQYITSSMSANESLVFNRQLDILKQKIYSNEVDEFYFSYLAHWLTIEQLWTSIKEKSPILVNTNDAAFIKIFEELRNEGKLTPDEIIFIRNSLDENYRKIKTILNKNNYNSVQELIEDFGKLHLNDKIDVYGNFLEDFLKLPEEKIQEMIINIKNKIDKF